MLAFIICSGCRAAGTRLTRTRSDASVAKQILYQQRIKEERERAAAVEEASGVGEGVGGGGEGPSKTPTNMIPVFDDIGLGDRTRRSTGAGTGTDLGGGERMVGLAVGTMVDESRKMKTATAKQTPLEAGGERSGRVGLLEDPALEMTDPGVWQAFRCVPSANGGVDVGHLSEEELRGMGRWGEAVAADVLGSRDDVCSVEWVNRTDEQCQPYDIVLRRKDDAQQV